MKYIKQLLLAIIAVASTSVALQASSHREAPLISGDPLADNVDLYAFRSPDNPDMVTIIATYVPLQLPHGGPNYYSFGENIRYEIHVDNDASVPGDEVTYRFTFDIVNEDPTTFFNVRLGQQNQKATYTLERSLDGGVTFETIVTDGIVPPNNIGSRSINSPVGLGVSYSNIWNAGIATASTGEQVFAGPTDDPFFVDLGGIFDLGNSSRQDGPSRDGLACYNVSALAIQVPISTLRKASAPATPTNILDADYVIGVWASASRPAMTTLSSSDNPSYMGDWVQVSRLGMPLTNEAVIPVGDKDFWNSITPYQELAETSLDEYFYNPELALYMDDDLFGGAVPAFAALRVQEASLGAFDFTNGADGVSGLRGGDLTGTAFESFADLLLIPGKPRSVDLWPIFHTGVPNAIPYQLATGKDGNPLAAGKPFINNFLPNGGDMLRLNMAVPVTPRDDVNFSSLGLIQAAAIGLTVAPFNETAELEFIPNMDGFPNGRRLEDDVTRIELQAVSGLVLAAIGLWYDDYDPASSPSPVTPSLLAALTYTTGVENNDLAFSSTFPYLAMPHSGTGACSGEIQLSAPPVGAASGQLFVSSNTSTQVGLFSVLEDRIDFDLFEVMAEDADGIHYDSDNDILYQLNRTDNVVNSYGDVLADLREGVLPRLIATSTSDFSNGRELTVQAGKLVVAQDASDGNGQVNQFVIYDIDQGAITLDRVVTSPINLWGIDLASDGTMYAIEDNSENVAVIRDFLSSTGTIDITQSVAVPSIVRTHGITYVEASDMMLLTDVGSGAVADDGAYSVINGWIAASADGVIDASEEVRVAGANTLLGNPVDVSYDEDNDLVFIAERANGGGRVLAFEMGVNGDVVPFYNVAFDGASAIYIDNRVGVVSVQDILPTYAAPNLYPNPTGDVLNIALGESTEMLEGADVTITDVGGRVVYTGASLQAQSQINVSGLENGMYVIIMQNASHRYTSKFFKVN